MKTIDLLARCVGPCLTHYVFVMRDLQYRKWKIGHIPMVLFLFWSFRVVNRDSMVKENKRIEGILSPN